MSTKLIDWFLYRNQLSIGYNFASSVESGVVTTVLTAPIWVIKTRMQLQQKLLVYPTLCLLNLSTRHQKSSSTPAFWVFLMLSDVPIASIRLRLHNCAQRRFPRLIHRSGSVPLFGLSWHHSSILPNRKVIVTSSLLMRSASTLRDTWASRMWTYGTSLWYYSIDWILWLY